MTPSWPEDFDPSTHKVRDIRNPPGFGGSLFHPRPRAVAVLPQQVLYTELKLECCEWEINIKQNLVLPYKLSCDCLLCNGLQEHYIRKIAFIKQTSYIKSQNQALYMSNYVIFPSVMTRAPITENSKIIVQSFT